MRFFVTSVVGLTLVSAVHTAAFAWGAVGHRLIAEVAEQQLTPQTRAAANQLLSLEPGATFVSVSTWADEVRLPGTARWHYVNMPAGACTYDQPRDCAGGQCVVEAITAQTRVLQSTAPAEERLRALKFVIHFIGDVHQPLHAGLSEDKGGNLFQVQAFGKGTNLHALWDSGLIANRPGGLGQLKQDVMQAGKTVVGQGAPASWAEASCRAVLTAGFYPDGRQLGAEDALGYDALLVQKMAEAAKRLADVLNRSLR